MSLQIERRLEREGGGARKADTTHDEAATPRTTQRGGARGPKSTESASKNSKGLSLREPLSGDETAVFSSGICNVTSIH